ncbi:phosphotransferase enzyme family protein [Xylogone sp. PMI_703]|nr:phosphotransferase enzyme family protein [Xylogone sp. PMI_703]
MGSLPHFINPTAIKTWNAGLDENNASGVNEPVAGALEPNPQEIPSVTEDQRKQARKAFIESIDSDAVCALASKFRNGRSCRVVSRESGSFNACFFVAFDQDEPEYLKRNTTIPLPRVHAYGRDAELTKTGTGTQMFLITDFILGRPLNKKLLNEASEEYRRNLYSGLIDVLAELRRLEFPLIGSLMPNPNGTADPVLGPAICMSAATLRLSPRQTFASANDYMAHQFGLVSAFFSQPVCDLTVDDIKQEVFALHRLEPIFYQIIDPQLDRGPFALNHMDLRSANIIVDDSLQVQGIIDWEFTSTVPRQVFTPPSWITGHDSIETNKQLHTEFRDVLDEKSRCNSACDQLRKEWYGQLDTGKSEDIVQTDMAFYVAHMLRCPTDATDIFYEFFAKSSDEDLDAVISNFFSNHQSLASEVQHRAEQCERYTQFLKTNGLYETDLDRLLAKGKELEAKWDWTSSQ